MSDTLFDRLKHVHTCHSVVLKVPERVVLCQLFEERLLLHTELFLCIVKNVEHHLLNRFELSAVLAILVLRVVFETAEERISLSFRCVGRFFLLGFLYCLAKLGHGVSLAELFVLFLLLSLLLFLPRLVNRLVKSCHGIGPLELLLLLLLLFLLQFLRLLDCLAQLRHGISLSHFFLLDLRLLRLQRRLLWFRNLVY